MALNATSLKTEIVAAMNAQGFITNGTHARADELATAIANAVVAHIQANAQVPVTAGSSTGTYNVV